MAEQELQVILLSSPLTTLARPLARSLAPSPSRKGGMGGGRRPSHGARARRRPGGAESSRIVAMGRHRAESGGLGRPQVTFSHGAEFFH